MKGKPIFWLIAIFISLLAACQKDDTLPTAVPAASLAADQTGTAVSTSPNVNGAANTPTPMPTDTAVPPTPTPPVAAIVNDQPLYLATYEKELARYEQAASQLGTSLDDDYRQQLLDALIEQLLIEQTAVAAGMSVTPEQVASEIESLRQLRGANDFANWLEQNLYTEEEFTAVVAQSLLAQQMIETVTNAVPQTAEQLHTRYIHVNDLALANELLTQAQNGNDFAALADQYSVASSNGGDMGWFARGMLTVPELEEPAFALAEAGALSPVITVTQADGNPAYYLLQLVEREEARPLTAEMRAPLLQAALDDWLAGLWQNAQIEQFVNAGSG